MDLGASDTVLGVCIGLGLSAAAGLRLFIPMVVMSAASLSGHLDLASGFEWIGTYPALIAFSAAAVLEVCGYLIPFVDHLLDVAAAPAALAAGTILTASSIVDMSPFLKWTLAVVAGGGIAGTVQLSTTAARLVSTATTAGMANPAVGAVEAGASTGVSLITIALPVLGLLIALVLAYFAVRLVLRAKAARGRPARAGT